MYHLPFRAAGHLELYPVIPQPGREKPNAENSDPSPTKKPETRCAFGADFFLIQQKSKVHTQPSAAVGSNFEAQARDFRAGFPMARQGRR